MWDPSMNSEIRGIETSIEELRSDLKALSKKMQDLPDGDELSELTDLASAVSALEDSNSDTAESVQSLEDSLSDLSNKVDVLETMFDDKMTELLEAIQEIAPQVLTKK